MDEERAGQPPRHGMTAWPPGDGEMARRIRAHDWARTPLGPVEGWSERLRAAVETILAMPGPATVLWGPAHVRIYNDAYVAVARDRHPALLGCPAAEGWPDAYGQVIAPLLDAVHAGRTTQLAGFPVALRGPDGGWEERVFDIACMPLRDEAGGVAGALQTLVEVTDRLRAEQALRESEARFRAAFEQANVGIVQASLDGRILVPNPGFCRIIGYDAETARTLTVRDITHPDDYDLDMGQAARVLAGEIPGYTMEKRYVRRDGEVVWVQMASSLVRDAAGAPSYALAVVEDITARKHAELDLRRANERFRLAEEAANGFVYDWDPGTGVARRSEGFGRVLGYGPGDVPETAEGWIDLIHPDDRAEAALTASAEPVGRNGYSAEYRVRRGDGRYVWVLDRGLVLRDPSSGGVRVGGSTVDITERKLAEVALRQSEARFRVLAEAVEDVFYITDFEARRLLYLSPGYERVWGRPAAELLADVSRFPDTVHPDDLPARREAQAARARGEPATVEYRIRRPDGEVRWVLDRCFPIRGAEGRLSAGVVSDVTERRRVQEALRESEARNALLVRFADEVRGLSDPALIAEASCRILAERLGTDRTLWAVIDPEGREYVAEWAFLADGTRAEPSRWPLDPWDPFAAEHLAGRAVAYDDSEGDPRIPAPVAEAMAERGLRAGIAVPVLVAGALRAVLNTSQPTAPRRWRPEEVAFVEALAGRAWAEIERARAEAALRESEEHLRHTVELNPQVAWTAAPDGTLDFAPQRWRDWTGVEGLGAGWADAVHPEDLPGMAARWMHAVRTGEPADIEHRIRMRDGTHRWMRSRAFPRRDAAGRIVRWYGTTEDIHDHRVAEEALRESEGRFRGFAEHSADVLWIADARGARLEYLSPAFERVFGEPRDRILADLGRWAELVHPEDRGAARSFLPRALAGEVATAHYRVVRPGDGRVVHLRDTGFPVRDEGGAIRQVAGIVQDVTDMVRAGEVLEAEKERFRTLAEGIPQLVWRSCDDGLWTWASPQWLDFTGQRQEESHGRGWLDAVHPDDRDRTMAAWHEARPHGMLDVEYRVRRAADGAYLWHHTRSVPVRDGEGRIVEWLGTSTDVQQLKELQERQAVMVAELQHRTRNLIGVVRSIAGQMMASSDTLEVFRARFNDRLAALARVQGLLSRAEEAPITIGALVRTELDALGLGDGAAGQVTLDGPSVRIRNSVVQTLSLALHELATNARKHGALANEEGRLAVRWRTREEAGERRLALEWAEEGVVTAPNTKEGGRRGYGRELIERALPYTLKARTRYELGEEGVRCTIDMPLERPARRRAS